MIIRDFTYKGQSLAETASGSTQIVVQSVNKDVKLRTWVFERANWHGASSSYTLASGRLFTVKGVIYGSTRAERYTGQAILNAIIKPEANPTPANRGFYDLTWTDDGGNQMKASAKVYSMPTYGHDTGSPIIEFTFELYSEDAYYTAPTNKTATGWYGTTGGISLPFDLPSALQGYIGDITVQNAGNFDAQCKIQVVGSVVSPRILNTTTGAYYGVNTTTTDLIVDTRTTKAIITNAGSDVTASRMAGSQYITIAPGINKIVLLGNNYSIGASVTVTITYADTYISS